MRRSQVLGGALALVLAGAAVAARQSNGPGGGHERSAARATAGLAASADTFAPAGGAPQASGGAVAREALAAPETARVVKTAALTVKVAKAASVTRSAQKANSIAESLGGFIANTETRAGEQASSTLTLRVPVANYDAALRQLRALGEVSDETLGGEDVTNQLVDLDARLRSLRAQEAALNALMAKANTVGETLQVAQAAHDVRTQIEQLAAQQKSLADQADFATITLVLAGPGVVLEGPSTDPVLLTALHRAAAASLAVIGGVVLVVGYALPAALLALVAYAALRLMRRRSAAVA